MKAFVKAAGIRAAKTFFQTILGLWTAGMLITQIDWETTLIAAASAAIYSLLTSIVTGLPEVDDQAPREMTEAEAVQWMEGDQELQEELVDYDYPAEEDEFDEGVE